MSHSSALIDCATHQQPVTRSDSGYESAALGVSIAFKAPAAPNLKDLGKPDDNAIKWGPKRRSLFKTNSSAFPAYL